jgi:hypothetical protein
VSSSVDIGLLGEKALVDYLRSSKYTNILWDSKSSGSDIEGANQNGARQLFQVRTAVLPESPGKLTEEEKAAFKARAENKGAQAWQARVQLTSDHQLSGNIEFTYV